ncbi:MAG: hypothetical protein WC006_01530 [Bacilli bacterium]
MNRDVKQKYISNSWYKILMVFIMLLTFSLLVSCGKDNDIEKAFADELTKANSYKVEGVMESFYDSGRKRNEFSVYYKNPDFIKVVIKSEDKSDKQIILKNTEGVYILIPAVNKNFKIQSSWPENASYPYLLQSLAKDIANDPELVKTEDENTVTIETKTKMHADAVPVRQKIVFDKVTELPTEVLTYDANDNLYIRTVFTNIDLAYNISDDEFDLNNSMSSVRLEYTEPVTYPDRGVGYPVYIPEGFAIASEKTTKNTDETEVLSIMKYKSEEEGFTIIQEFINDSEVVKYQEEKAEIVILLGNLSILKKNSVQTIYNGVEYTVASSELSLDEIIKITQSYMIVQEEK